MPEIIKNKSKNNNKKPKRLGRGLGSLLTTDIQSFEDEKPSNSKSIEADKAVPSQAVVKQAAPVPSQKKPQKPKFPEVVTKKKLNSQASQPIQSVQKKVEPKPAPVVEKPVEKPVEVQVKVNDTNRIWNAPVDKVYPNKRQPRKDFEQSPLLELSNSIKEQGILQPITVRRKDDGGYEIIAGERRWRAAQKAGLHEVPVIIKDVDDQKVMELALIENIQRENLNPVEEAIAFQQLVDEYSLTQAEVATKVGKDRATVANALRVLTLPKEVKRALRSREISTGHAKVLLSLDDEEKQLSMLKLIIAEKLSVRALEKEVRKQKSGQSDAFESTGQNVQLESLTLGLQKALGTKVKIKYRKGKGRFEIAFYSDEQFQSLMHKFGKES